MQSISQEIKHEIINLFESVEMKECITKYYDSLHILTKADIIEGARIDIQKKFELLKNFIKVLTNRKIGKSTV